MASRQNFLQSLSNRKALLALDQITTGQTYTVSHEGIGQYALGGPSACGIIAMNCVRHILNLEKDGFTDNQLVTKLLEKETMEVCQFECLSSNLPNNCDYRLITGHTVSMQPLDGRKPFGSK